MNKGEGVSNYKPHRDISDKLDNLVGWNEGYKEESGTRGVIHGIYHGAIASYKYACGDYAGATDEWDRAKYQFSLMKE